MDDQSTLPSSYRSFVASGRYNEPDAPAMNRSLTSLQTCHAHTHTHTHTHTHSAHAQRHAMNYHMHKETGKNAHAQRHANNSTRKELPTFTGTCTQTRKRGCAFLCGSHFPQLERARRVAWRLANPLRTNT